MGRKNTPNINTIPTLKWPEKEEKKPLRNLDPDQPRRPRRPPRRLPSPRRKLRRNLSLERNGKSGKVPDKRPLVASPRRTFASPRAAKLSPRNNLLLLKRK